MATNTNFFIQLLENPAATALMGSLLMGVFWFSGICLRNKNQKKLYEDKKNEKRTDDLKLSMENIYKKLYDLIEYYYVFYDTSITTVSALKTFISSVEKGGDIGNIHNNFNKFFMAAYDKNSDMYENKIPKAKRDFLAFSEVYIAEKELDSIIDIFYLSNAQIDAIRILVTKFGIAFHAAYDKKDIRELKALNLSKKTSQIVAAKEKNKSDEEKIIKTLRAFMKSKQEGYREKKATFLKRFCPFCCTISQK